MLAMFPCAGRAKTIDTGQADLIGGYTPVAGVTDIRAGDVGRLARGLNG
jgi:hypothetical protein